MANAGCINAIGFDGSLIRTLQNLDSSNIGVGVQFTAPNPLDDKRFDYIKYTDKNGNTCCLTGENEILIYATNGTIKNLTLTNDDTNEVVNVKRSDVFGSNWKKTVVRYKTGGYPTSITDGTLAVEELVQNQYQSSGYNVSGLTDGTTYYFSAFAVAQDDTVIVVQSKNITPSFKRKRPVGLKGGYWKLNGNMLDSSGNGHDGNGNSNYTTGHKAGTQSYNASSSSYYVKIPSSSELYMQNGESFSFGFRVCPKYGSGTGSTFGVISMTRNVDSYSGRSIHNDSMSGNRQFRTHANGQSQNSNQLTALTWNANERFHLVITYDGTTVKYYKNSTLLGSFTYTVGDCSTSYNLTIGYASTWSAYGNALFQEAFYMKNKCLTQAEITKIYSDT